MLGDLFAERTKPTHNTRLVFEQSSRHESYLMYLYSIVKNMVNTPPKYPKRKPHYKIGLIYPSIAFKTLKFPCLNIFHELFYPNGLKVIPDNITDYFTDISLAFWIMDDGLRDGGGLRLCTDSYLYYDILILVEMLNNKYYIYCYPQF